MTLKEVAYQLNRSEKTLTHSFKRTQENLLKQGIELTKEGYGKSANYTIRYIKKPRD